LAVVVLVPLEVLLLWLETQLLVAASFKPTVVQAKEIVAGMQTVHS
jgi:hypothetical protein